MPNTLKKNKLYSATDMRAVSDNPEWTRKDFAKAKRFDKVFPNLASTIRRSDKQKRTVRRISEA